MSFETRLSFRFSFHGSKFKWNFYTENNTGLVDKLSSQSSTTSTNNILASLLTMAIPFYTDENANASPNSNNYSGNYSELNGRRLRYRNRNPGPNLALLNNNSDRNNNRASDRDDDEGVEGNSNENSNEGFTHQLIRELYSLYCSMRSSGSSGAARGQRSSRRSRVQSGGVDDNMEDNQENLLPQPEPASIRTTNNPPLLPLPDIISCHLEGSLRIHHQNPSTNQQNPPRGQNDPDQAELNPEEPVALEVRAFSNGLGGGRGDPGEDSGTSSDDEGNFFGIDFKLHFECSYQSIGRDLRQVADSFETQHASRRQRRRASGPGLTSCSLDLKVALKVALPAVALVGLGLGLLRRSV